MSRWGRVLGAVVSVVMIVGGLLTLGGIRWGYVFGAGGGVVMIVGGLLVFGGSMAYEWRCRRRRRDYS
jgi:cell division protein FtsW (lipid II flippase)